MANRRTKELLKDIIDDIKKDINDEELIQFLLNQKINETTKKVDQRMTFGQKAADMVAKFAGSWVFIILFLVLLLLWILSNLILATKAYDPYPFILLNLILSTIAAIQAPLIMMSQNRREEKDRQRNINDYRVNLKSEIVIADLHRKIEELLILEKRLKNIEDMMSKQTNK